MPNATLRANARPTPETTNRRAVLAAVLAASAAGATALALPAVSAMAGPATAAGPDAELFLLIAAAREVNTRLDAAEGAAEEAYQRTEKVPWPQALVVTEDDTRLWKLKAGDRFELSHLDLMRKRQSHRQNAKYVKPFSVIAADAPYIASLDEKDRVLIEQMAAAEAGEDRLVAALDEWNEGRGLARDRSGETAADERLEEIQAEHDEACKRVANMRARTLDGVLTKLAFITPDLDPESWMGRGSEMGTHEQILFSVAVDYRAIESTLASIEAEGAMTALNASGVAPVEPRSANPPLSTPFS